MVIQSKDPKRRRKKGGEEDPNVEIHASDQRCRHVQESFIEVVDRFEECFIKVSTGSYDLTGICRYFQNPATQRIPATRN